MLNSATVSKFFSNFFFLDPCLLAVRWLQQLQVAVLTYGIPIPGREQEGKEFPFQVFFLCQGGKSFFRTLPADVLYIMGPEQGHMTTLSYMGEEMFSFFKTQLGFGTVGLTEAGRKKPVLRAHPFPQPNGPSIQEVPWTTGYHDVFTNKRIMHCA